MLVSSHNSSLSSLSALLSPFSLVFNERAQVCVCVIVSITSLPVLSCSNGGDANTLCLKPCEYMMNSLWRFCNVLLQKLLCWQNKYVNFCWTFVIFRIGIPACGAAAFFIITSCTSILMSETSASLSVFWAGHWTHIQAFLCQREEDSESERDLKPAMKMSASITRAAWTCFALPYFNFNDSHSVDQWGVPSENDTFRDLPIKSPGDPYQGDAHPSCRRTQTHMHTL